MTKVRPSLFGVFESFLSRAVGPELSTLAPSCVTRLVIPFRTEPRLLEAVIDPSGRPALPLYLDVSAVHDDELRK